MLSLLLNHIEIAIVWHFTVIFLLCGERLKELHLGGNGYKTLLRAGVVFNTQYYTILLVFLLYCSTPQRGFSSKAPQQAGSEWGKPPCCAQVCCFLCITYCRQQTEQPLIVCLYDVSDLSPLGITVVETLLNCFPPAVGATIAAVLVRSALSPKDPA